MDISLKTKVEFDLLGLDYKILSIQQAQTELATLITEVNQQKEPIICLAENPNVPQAVLISFTDFVRLLDRLDELDTTVSAIEAHQAHLKDSSGMRSWHEVKAELSPERVYHES